MVSPVPVSDALSTLTSVISAVALVGVGVLLKDALFVAFDAIRQALGFGDGGFHGEYVPYRSASSVDSSGGSAEDLEAQASFLAWEQDQIDGQACAQEAYDFYSEHRPDVAARVDALVSQGQAFVDAVDRVGQQLDAEKEDRKGTEYVSGGQ